MSRWEGAGFYLRGRADVDPKRIGLWGGSYGGYLTAMGLSRASDLFVAGVDFHGVHDCSARMSAAANASDVAARNGPRIVAHGVGEDLALAGAADPWR